MDFSIYKKGVFLVNVLGVIYNPNTKKILIGKREKDRYFEGLTWCFPGGTPEYFGDLDYYLKHEVRQKTSLDVDIIKVLFAKTYPEKRHFLSIYYLCEAKNGKETPQGNFKELKWIFPKEIQKYFTTSIHPELLEIIKSLDKQDKIEKTNKTKKR